MSDFCIFALVKIVHCVWSFEVGGVETMLVDIIRRQVADGHQITLVIINRNVDPQLLAGLPHQVSIKRLGRKVGSRNPWPLLRLNREIRRGNPDIIHVHFANIPAAFIGRPKAKVVYTVHALHRSPKWFSRMDAVVAISHAVKEELAQRTDKPIEVIVNGVDVSSIKMRPLDRPASSPLKVVMVGRLQLPVKGQDVLLEAARLLDSKIEVTLVGDGPSRSRLEKMAPPLTKFTGAKTRSWIYEHLADFDLMVHSSRLEGFGLTVAEGMAAGLPVIVSSNTGAPEVCGEEGNVFENGDPEDCARAISEAIADYDNLAKHAQRRRARVENLYGVQTQVRAYEQLYQRLLKA